MTTAQTIRNHIASLAFGELLTALGLLEAGCGSRDAIDQTLSRLSRAGLITRIARGVYTKPRASRFGGVLLPDPVAMAHAFAKLRGLTLELNGAEAIRRFGLSTQMPAQLSFQTSGRTHTLRVGKLTVTLEHAPNNRLLLAGRLAGQALTALLYIGRERIKSQDIRRVLEQLPAPEREALKPALPNLPRWLSTPLALALM